MCYINKFIFEPAVSYVWFVGFNRKAIMSAYVGESRLKSLSQARRKMSWSAGKIFMQQAGAKVFSDKLFWNYAKTREFLYIKLASHPFV